VIYVFVLFYFFYSFNHSFIGALNRPLESSLNCWTLNANPETSWSGLSFRRRGLPCVGSRQAGSNGVQTGAQRAGRLAEAQAGKGWELFRVRGAERGPIAPVVPRLALIWPQARRTLRSPLHPASHQSHSWCLIRLCFLYSSVLNSLGSYFSVLNSRI
jgi:hypothetical protein